MNRVFTAYESYQPGRMGSLGDAMYMLIRQHNFPDTFEDSEKLVQADHDRVMMWDREHARGCFKKYTGTGELGLCDWALKADPEKIKAFLIDILKVDRSVEWTGFRILGSVHRGNGYPVWSLALFAKNPDSSTQVYSGYRAPNVRNNGVSKSSGYRIY